MMVSAALYANSQIRPGQLARGVSCGSPLKDQKLMDIERKDAADWHYSIWAFVELA